MLGEDPLIRELGPVRESTTLRALEPAAGYRLRVVYLIPGNRTAQPEAKEVLQGFVVRMQDWFRDHMERLGYTPKTFTYESAADGDSEDRFHPRRAAGFVHLEVSTSDYGATF